MNNQQIIVLDADQISLTPIHNLYDLKRFGQTVPGFECKLLGLCEALDNSNYPGKVFKASELLQFLPECSIETKPKLEEPYIIIRGIDPERALKKMIFNLHKQGFRTFNFMLRRFKSKAGATEFCDPDFTFKDLYQR